MQTNTPTRASSFLKVPSRKIISILLIQFLSVFILSACGGGGGSSNESPTIADASFKIPENAAIGAGVGTVAGNDPDGDLLTYSIVQIAATGTVAKVAPEGTFAIGDTSGQITVANKSAFNPLPTEPLTITVQVADESGETDTATVTITVTDVNIVPAGILTNPNLSVANIAANGAPVGDPLGTANDGLAFSIVGGNTGNAFIIDPVTGQITVNDATAINSGDSFQLEVQVTDGTLTNAVVITITVEDVTLVPAGFNPSIGFNGADIANGALVGGPLGTATDGLTFSIVGGNENGAFVIDPETGQISIELSSEIILGETVNLVIQITDGTLTETVTIAIAISDLVDPTSTTPTSVDNTAQNGDTVAGPFGTVDDGLTFSIIGGNDSGAFSIDPATGEITVNDSGALGSDSFDLVIQVTNGTVTDTFTITINVNQVNVAPILNDITLNLAASKAIGSNVGAALAATDADGDTLSYTITGGNAGNAFNIVETSGQITSNTAPMVGTSTVTVTVSDGIATDTATVTINTFHDFEGKTVNVIAFGDSMTTGASYSEENIFETNAMGIIIEPRVRRAGITAQAVVPLDAQGLPPFGQSYRSEVATIQGGSSNGVKINFIGTKTDGDVWRGDAENDGWAGFSSNLLVTGFTLGEDTFDPIGDLNSGTIMDAETGLTNGTLADADVVFMTAGTNDVLIRAEKGTIVDTEREVKVLIDQMRSVNPNLVFLLAKVFQFDGTNTTIYEFAKGDVRTAFASAQAYSTALTLSATFADGTNAALEKVAADYSTPNSPVVIVDMPAVFNGKQTELLSDGIHPNNIGEVEMAKKWVEALDKFFDGVNN